MTYKIKLEQFEGPLDLLLQLIEENELDITQVSLAQVTDQYIEYLNQLEYLNPDILADFLVIAAKLLLIKSKSLLPYLTMDEEDEGEELEKQLKIYKEFLEASKVVNQMIQKKKFSYVREKMPVSDIPVFNPPKNLTKDKLNKIFCEIIADIKPLVAPPKKKMTKVVSISEKINQIKNTILNKASLDFGELIKNSKDKTEVIVSFLALLELVKQKTIAVNQKDKFSDIKIIKV